ncbi:hypothetical protein [Thermoflavifilum thermophilum]|uniref:hypothetical protein n=1 Tax=Thermoflavifilum thermophilum TaxID=1393122 RepID=UPI001160883D|nr:hypothetical protein [Thermoflavifilum thermophilum]
MQARPEQEYFSLKQYFTQQIDSFLQDSGRISLMKVVSLNQHSDTTWMPVTRQNLMAIFQPFMAMDIDRPAFRGMYQIESFEDSLTGKITIIYTSQGAVTKPYQIYLQVNPSHTIHSIYVKSMTDNFLYHTSKQLLYQAGKSVEIITYEHMQLFAPRRIYVRVLFAPQA